MERMMDPRCFRFWLFQELVNNTVEAADPQWGLVKVESSPSSSSLSTLAATECSLGCCCHEKVQFGFVFQSRLTEAMATTTTTTRQDNNAALDVSTLLENLWTATTANNSNHTDNRVVLCLVLLGTTAATATMEADTVSLHWPSGWLRVRNAPNQILPLLSFGIDNNYRQTISAIVEGFESVVQDLLDPTLPRSPLQSHHHQDDIVAVDNSNDDKTTGSWRRRKRSPSGGGGGRIGEWDVLCDRQDPRCRSHHGNRRFAMLATIHAQKNSTWTDRDRLRPARNLVQVVCTKGRFLKRSTSTTTTTTTRQEEEGRTNLVAPSSASWVEMDYEEILHWIEEYLPTSSATATALTLGAETVEVVEQDHPRGLLWLQDDFAGTDFLDYMRNQIIEENLQGG